MAYIGKTPLVGNYQICDALTASATADYTLQVGGVNVSPQSANAMIVSLNSVIQAPGASGGFTVSGSTISFNSALTSSDVINFIYILGDVLDIGTPTDGTVTAAKLAADSVTTAKILDDNVTTAKILDNNVTLAKLADGTQGDILYYGASGAPALLGFGTSGDFLKTQGTGANPVWATVGGGVLQVKAVEVTDVQSNTATAPAAITAFNIVFTPTSASSKLWLQTSITVGASSTAIMGYFYDSTGAVIIGPIADAAGSRSRYSFGTGTPANQSKMTIGAGAWFTPGDTTARTIQVFLAAQSTNTLYINRGYTDTDDNTIDHSRGASTFVITEYDGSLVTIA